jgi:hypothetical protein
MWHNILTHGNASLGFQWALLGRDSAINSDATRNPIFFALQQFFQHIPIGSRRIAARSDHPNLLVSAFKHVEKNCAQIILINRAPIDLSIVVHLQNLNLGELESFRTSEREPHVPVSTFHLSGQQIQLSMPSTSIMTFTGTMTVAKDVVPPSPPTGVIIKERE